MSDAERIEELERKNAELLATLKEVTETLYRHLERPRQSAVLRKAKHLIELSEALDHPQ
jgi:hypothetical protein